MTSTSIDITTTDHTGSYGTNRNWATRLSEARRTPGRRAPSAPLRRPAPVPAARMPRTRWTQPQPVRLSP
jgi:hypothetical protein